MQSHHLHLEVRKHPLHLVVLSLINRKKALTRVQQFNLRRRRGDFFFRKPHPLFKKGDHFCRNLPIRAHPIAFPHLPYWLGDRLGNPAIIGHNKEPGRKTIEPPREMKFIRPIFLNEAYHRGMFRIHRRADHSLRLVEHDIASRSVLDDFRAHLDKIKITDLHCPTGGEGAIDPHFASLNLYADARLSQATPFPNQTIKSRESPHST